MGMSIDVGELLKAMGTWDKFGNDPNKGLIPLRTPTLQDRYVPYVKYDDMIKCVKGMPTVEAIPKADYEARLKADMVAMLTEIQLEIDELEVPLLYLAEDYEGGVLDCKKIIQQKINALRGE